MKLIEYADREVLAMDLANLIAGELKNALLSHDTVSFAVPGGTTPGPIFDSLSAANLEWARVQVMLGDERWVDPDHEMSNARLLRNRLLVGRAAEAAFTPFYIDGLTSAEAAETLSPQIESRLPLSVLLLGMGADMHTASLFPGSNGLEAAMAADAPALCPIDVDGQDIGRITLSRRVLEGAMSKHLVIFGDEKRVAVEQAQSLPALQAPIGAVLNEATVHWAP
ncbi:MULTISPECIES: 6-phosphogluconolactonase [Sulfitobacter]|uniref:6-phosphogluconolactonase n=1 Tax=Sulfitobacter TaxID=60136 RepID=UPI000E98ECAD|nr:MULTISPECIES: 6-phosphogluconolactonase [Sulfitobacter]HAR81040.1 6-phosphogluconolactonase [Sulfitobacter pontiacus]HBR41915.1 6-phosphogluconolactonase [Sulfitobacter pontiacus]|tara:strand:+ start:1252 stop:1923 length:672 start_codon:yes stop_codon:yes gene_type:complete